MTQLIAAGSTLANSADFTVVAGVPNALFITPGGSADGPMPSGVTFLLQHKSSAGYYTTVAVLDAANIVQNGVISGPGTYRVQRLASPPSALNTAGMDIE